MLWRDPRAGDFFHHGNAQRDSSHNFGPQAGKSIILVLRTLHQPSTVAGTSATTIQQSASAQNPSFESLEQALMCGCPLVYATNPTIERHVDIRVLRLSVNK